MNFSFRINSYDATNSWEYYRYFSLSWSKDKAWSRNFKHLNKHSFPWSCCFSENVPFSDYGKRSWDSYKKFIVLFLIDCLGLGVNQILFLRLGKIIVYASTLDGYIINFYGYLGQHLVNNRLIGNQDYSLLLGWEMNFLVKINSDEKSLSWAPGRYYSSSWSKDRPWSFMNETMLNNWYVVPWSHCWSTSVCWFAW